MGFGPADSWGSPGSAAAIHTARPDSIPCRGICLRAHIGCDRGATAAGVDRCLIGMTRYATNRNRRPSPIESGDARLSFKVIYGLNSKTVTASPEATASKWPSGEKAADITAESNLALIPRKDGLSGVNIRIVPSLAATAK